MLMVTDGVIIGTQDHDKVGENFLKDLGMLFILSAYISCNNPHFVLSFVSMDE
jgi:hypothetical protein